MADIDPNNIASAASTAGGAGGILAGIVAFLFNRHVKRIDAHEERIRKIETKTATSEDIDAMIAQIDTSMKSLHNRIDNIYSILAKRD